MVDVGGGRDSKKSFTRAIWCFLAQFHPAANHCIEQMGMTSSKASPR
jgi:hypothetical protein